MLSVFNTVVSVHEYKYFTLWMIQDVVEQTPKKSMRFHRKYDTKKPRKSKQRSNWIHFYTLTQKHNLIIHKTHIQGLHSLQTFTLKNCMFFPNTTCMSHKALHCCTHFEKKQDVCLCVRVCVCVCALAHTCCMCWILTVCTCKECVST